VRSGDRGREAIGLVLTCFQLPSIAPLRGFLQRGAISPATTPYSWYTRATPARETLRGGGVAMTFEELLDQALAMLQCRGRVTYRALKLQFMLDDERLEALKDELLYAHPQVVDDDGQGLIWTGSTVSVPAAAAHSTYVWPRPPGSPN
jgi:hypothetical protein